MTFGVKSVLKMNKLDAYCRCGHDYQLHLWDINANPEGEADYEELACKECCQYDAWGMVVDSDCNEFVEEA